MVNTHLRFSAVLKDRQQNLEGYIEGNTKVGNAFNTASKCFINESEKSVEILTVLVSDDFRQGLMEGLFKDEWVGTNGIAIIDTLRATLEDYIADLKVWLTLESHVKKVLCGILRAVNACYLELLLTAGLSVTGRVGERLMEDVIAITHAFHTFSPSLLQSEYIDREFKPLKDVVLFLRMDLRQMAQFVRSELYTDFGPMAVKIFSHAMCMREETKQVQVREEPALYCSAVMSCCAAAYYELLFGCAVLLCCTVVCWDLMTYAVWCCVMMLWGSGLLRSAAVTGSGAGGHHQGVGAHRLQAAGGDHLSGTHLSITDMTWCM